MGGAPAACQAGIVVIFTPLLWPAKVTVTVPPRIVVTQGAVRGTVTTLSAPVGVTRQPAGAVPDVLDLLCEEGPHFSTDWKNRFLSAYDLGGIAGQRELKRC